MTSAGADDCVRCALAVPNWPGVGGGGGQLMYWKFGAVALPGKLIAGCRSAPPGAAGFDGATTGAAQAKQATLIARMSGFIEACWFRDGKLRCARSRAAKMVRREIKKLQRSSIARLTYKRYPR